MCGSRAYRELGCRGFSRDIGTAAGHMLRATPPPSSGVDIVLDSIASVATDSGVTTPLLTLWLTLIAMFAGALKDSLHFFPCK